MSATEVRAAGIILAAGTSTRMGALKPLLPFENSLLLERVIENAHKSDLDHITVVLGHKASFIRERIAFKESRIVINREYESGQSSSLKAGLRDLPEWVNGAVFLLGDQPFVGSKIINSLLIEFTRHPSSVIIPTCSGIRGNPVIFPRAQFSMVEELRGDIGGRALFVRLKDKLLEVEVSDLAVLQDLDTREDYRRLVGTDTGLNWPVTDN